MTYRKPPQVLHLQIVIEGGDAEAEELEDEIRRIVAERRARVESAVIDNDVVGLSLADALRDFTFSDDEATDSNVRRYFGRVFTGVKTVGQFGNLSREDIDRAIRTPWQITALLKFLQHHRIRLREG
jgi:hypothetical protein